MGLPIEELLEKYWNGETNLVEEQLIKDHFKQNPQLSNESQYFRHLESQKKVKYHGEDKGKRKRTAWLSAAATVTVGVLTALLIINDAKKDPFAIEDPQEALEATRKVLMLIGSELNEGQSHTLGLTRINKAREELMIEEQEEI